MAEQVRCATFPHHPHPPPPPTLTPRQCVGWWQRSATFRPRARSSRHGLHGQCTGVTALRQRHRRVMLEPFTTAGPVPFQTWHAVILPVTPSPAGTRGFQGCSILCTTTNPRRNPCFRPCSHSQGLTARLLLQTWRSPSLKSCSQCTAALMRSTGGGLQPCAGGCRSTREF